MDVGQRSKLTLKTLVTGVNGLMAGLNCVYQQARLLIVQCGGLGTVRLFLHAISGFAQSLGGSCKVSEG